MKVYISGPITGTKDYMERFAAAEQELTSNGHVVINPAKVNSNLPEGTTHAEYMKISLELLDMCDTMFMMEGWQHSQGCHTEMARAIVNKMTITFEGGKECQSQNNPEQGSFHKKPGKKFM